ncbi:MAG: hypothetical protein HDS42_02725 [Bacteroides sp.]|nr:hypothetical protein [Bacteroides sp.]
MYISFNKKIVLYILVCLMSFMTIPVYGQIQGGPWNTLFGETTSQTQSKLKKINPQIKLDVLAGQQILILSDVYVAGEVFSGGCYGYQDNKLVICIFQKLISYDDGFTHHLSYYDAENWLRSNKFKVTAAMNSIKKILSSKYGNPFKETDMEIRWRDAEGNSIGIIVDKVVNLAEKDQEMTRQFGCLPAYSISLTYAKAPEIPNY